MEFNNFHSSKCNQIISFENDEKCGEKANYNYFNENMGEYCFIHKRKNMVNLGITHCYKNKCITQPSFSTYNEFFYKQTGNIEFDYKIVSCKKHIQETNREMLNCIKIYCEMPYCLISASFNNDKRSSGKYCKKHKKDGMFNVNVRFCLEKDCFNVAKYNDMVPLVQLIDDKIVKNQTPKPEYCLIHKKETNVFMDYPICKQVRCFGVAQYKYDDEKQVKLCFLHKLPNMIKVGNSN